MINFKTPLAYELEAIMYDRLVNNGELKIDDLFEVSELLPEYGLRRVNGGAIHILRERPDVEQTKCEKGYMMFKLIKENGVVEMENQTHLNAVGEITELLYNALNTEDKE